MTSFSLKIHPITWKRAPGHIYHLVLFFRLSQSHLGITKYFRIFWNLHTLIIGGGTKYECWDPKWISMSFQYIRSGKKEFLNLVTILTLHIDPQYLKNPYIRVKSQSCCRPMVWPIKTCARRALSQPKKNRLNRTYYVREKSKKLPENTTFLENGIFG